MYALVESNLVIKKKIENNLQIIIIILIKIIIIQLIHWFITIYGTYEHQDMLSICYIGIVYIHR